VVTLSSEALTSSDKSGLRVRLELIDELQESFKKVLGELEELDFEEIEIDLSKRFNDIFVILKLSVRAEISKRASQLLSHSTFADGITPGVLSPSSVSLDIGQHCCPYLSFQDSLEVMQSGLIFILYLQRS